MAIIGSGTKSKISGAVWLGLGVAVGMVVLVPIVGWAWSKVRGATGNVIPG